MIIRISAFTVRAVIGILPHERTAPQRLHVSALIEYDYQNPQTFIDYAKIAALIEERLKTGQFELIEEALEAILPEILAQSPVIAKVEMTIEKPDILPHASVSVTHALARQP